MALSGDDLWKAKIAAFLHDPPDKQIVLFDRAAGGHEGVASALRNTLGISSDDDRRLFHLSELADWMASGADRVTQTKDRNDRVDFRTDPAIVHPLSGKNYSLGSMATVDWPAVSAAVREAMAEITTAYATPKGDTPVLQQRFLSLWRELRGRLESRRIDVRMGELWGVLPADSRVPDHSIWDHLRLSSALAGALAGPNGGSDGEAALLVFAIGPVQPFIAAARKTQDLWAGSWILSWLAWRSLLPVVARIGPDAVVFPDLREQALVDRWLVSEMGIGAVDPSIAPAAHALTRASLPNRFLAIVPAKRAEELAQAAEESFRDALTALSDKSLEVAIKRGPEESLRQAARSQLRGYFRTSWAAVPWPSDHQSAVAHLEAAFPAPTPQPLPALTTDRKLRASGLNLFPANKSGMLYGDFCHLAERALAVVKLGGTFEALEIPPGRRCAQTGDLAPIVRGEPRGTEHQEGSLPISDRLAPGEELSAVVLIKRVLRQTLRDLPGIGLGVDEHVNLSFPSTGSVAAATWLENIADSGSSETRDLAAALRAEPETLDYGQSVPAKTLRALRRAGVEPLGRIDASIFFSGDAGTLFVDDDGRTLAPAVREAAGKLITEHGTPTPYFAVVRADGDDMGAWLSGEKAPKIREIYHPKVQPQLTDAESKVFGELRRPVSPALHAAISRALGVFSGTIVPALLEKRCSGKLIYSGGDDLLGVVPLADITTLVGELPAAFSGIASPFGDGTMRAEGGFANIDGKLHMLMGPKASLSGAIVVAHQKAPLQMILKVAHEAEERAKAVEGKNSVCLTILKHSGERLEVVAPWCGQSPESGEIFWLAEVLGDWVANFGDGTPLEGGSESRLKISPTLVRAVREEIAPVITGAARNGGEDARSLAIDFFVRRAQRDVTVVDSSAGVASDGARKVAFALLETQVRRLLAFVAGATRVNGVEPARMVSDLLSLTLFLARHRRGRRGRRRAGEDRRAAD